MALGLLVMTPIRQRQHLTVLDINGMSMLSCILMLVCVVAQDCIVCTVNVSTASTDISRRIGADR